MLPKPQLTGKWKKWKQRPRRNVLRILKDCNTGRSGLSDRVDIVDLDSALTQGCSSCRTSRHAGHMFQLKLWYASLRSLPKHSPSLQRLRRGRPRKLRCSRLQMLSEPWRLHESFPWTTLVPLTSLTLFYNSDPWSTRLLCYYCSWATLVIEGARFSSS